MNSLKEAFSKQNLLKNLNFFGELNLGLILTAVGIVYFKNPNHFAFGGTSGLSILLADLFPKINVGGFMWIINLVLVVLGFVFLGVKCMGWTIYSSFALSFFVSVCEWLYPSGVSMSGDAMLDLVFAVFLPALGAAIVFDIGASTGGFTDCMLQNGATKVYSVDVGQGQLAWKLRNDERVVCMEQTNFRYVTPEDIPDALDFASVDVSFISLTKILIPARNLLKTGGQMVCLIKPQFEAGRGKVGKNGVVREPQIHEEVIRKIIDYADSIGFEVLHLEYSPIKGPEGNIEYLLHIRKPEGISEEKLALTEHEAESLLQTIVEGKTGLSYTPEWDAVIKGIVDNSHTL